MPDEYTDAAAESSTATDTADPSQATTQPAQQNGGSQFVPYERFQQVNGRMRTYEQTAAQQAQEIARLKEQLGQFQPKPKSEEEIAREALHRLDPNIPKYGEQLGELQGAVSEFRQERFVQRGEGLIAQFAQQHGVDAPALSNRIAEIIANDPALFQRAKNGDTTVVQHFLRAIEPVVDQLKRAGQVQQSQQNADLARNKVQLRNQPPRPGSSPSGQPAPEVFDPKKDNPRDFWERVSGRAKQAIRGAAEG